MSDIKRETIERNPGYDPKDLRAAYPELQWVCACGVDRFEVFFGDYRTLLKCTGCGYIACTHSG